MTAHSHQWLADRSRGNFTCTVDGCLVKGYAPSITSWQHRGANQGVKVYMCRAYVGDRKRLAGIGAVRKRRSCVATAGYRNAQSIRGRRWGSEN